MPLSPNRLMGRNVLRALIRRNAIRRGRDGDGYWLDEERYDEVRDDRRRIVLIVAAVLAVLAVLLLLVVRP